MSAFKINIQTLAIKAILTTKSYSHFSFIASYLSLSLIHIFLSLQVTYHCSILTALEHHFDRGVGKHNVLYKLYILHQCCTGRQTVVPRNRYNIVVFSLPLNTTLIEEWANIMFCINSIYFISAAPAARQ